MRDTTAYLAGAIAYRFYRETDVKMPGTLEELRTELANFFECHIEPNGLAVAAYRARDLGILNLVENKWAGTILSATKNQIDESFDRNAKDNPLVFVKPQLGGEHLYSLMLQNPEFWVDTGHNLDNTAVIDESLQVPASDRIVAISDNQIAEIEDASEDLLVELGQQNGDDGDTSKLDRSVGQIKAARELVRAQSVRVYLVYETIVRLLNDLIERFSGQAIGEAAKVLLRLYIEYVLKRP